MKNSTKKKVIAVLAGVITFITTFIPLFMWAYDIPVPNVINDAIDKMAAVFYQNKIMMFLAPDIHKFFDFLFILWFAFYTAYCVVIVILLSSEKQNNNQN